MDPNSDRITMNLGTWYGSVNSMIDAVVKCGADATTLLRAQQIAHAMRVGAAAIECAHSGPRYPADE